MKKYVWALIVLVIAAICAGCSLGGATQAPTISSTLASPSAATGDAVIAQAFRDRKSGVEVTGQGVVIRLLADDNAGDRHQRFIVRLATGQTVLFAHNIDIAPRLSALRTGDTVSFKGIYEWSAQGGTIHWTHHDPSGQHPTGWLSANGQTSQ